MRMNILCEPEEGEGMDAVPVYKRIEIVEKFDLFIAGESVAFAVHESCVFDGCYKLSHWDSGLSISGSRELGGFTSSENREKAQRLIDEKVGKVGSKCLLEKIRKAPRINFRSSEIEALWGIR